MKSGIKLIAIAMTTLLGACGGGGGGGGSSSAPAPASTSPTTIDPQGTYSGKTLTGEDIYITVLENNETYILYAKTGLITGGAYGVPVYTPTGTATGNVLLAYGSSTTQAILAGNISSKLAFVGSVGSPGNTVTFNAAYRSSYDTHALLSDATGTWSGKNSTNGETVSLSIDSTGHFSGSGSLGCNFTGAIVPRASGKNVFDTTITFGGGVCALQTATTTGAAIIDDSTQPKPTIALFSLNSDKSNGFLFMGGKQ